MHWTNCPTQASFLTIDKAEEIGLQVLEEIDIACEIVGTYV